MGGPQPKVKTFEIDKRLVQGAWEKVRANQGAFGAPAEPGRSTPASARATVVAFPKNSVFIRNSRTSR